ncbi:MAG: hypothetical protein U1G08_10240 [Verrucomicrobiota bacterium]
MMLPMDSVWFAGGYLNLEFSDGDVAFEVSEFRGDSCDMDRKGDLSLWERSRGAKLDRARTGSKFRRMVR